MVAAFNDLEMVLIDLLGGMLGNRDKADAVGWAISFRGKLDVVAALAPICDLPAHTWKPLKRELERAAKLSEEVRDPTVHAEVWENPFDNSFGWRKGTVRGGRGFRAQHLEFTPAGLQRKVTEIREFAARMRQATAYFDFAPSE